MRTDMLNYIVHFYSRWD